MNRWITIAIALVGAYLLASIASGSVSQAMTCQEFMQKDANGHYLYIIFVIGRNNNQLVWGPATPDKFTRQSKAVQQQYGPEMKRRTSATRTACAAKLAAAPHPPAAPPPPVPKPALGNVDPNAGGYQFAWWWAGYHGLPVNFWGKLTGSIGNYEFTTTESPSSSMFQDGVPASRGNAHCQITGSDRGYLFNCIATFPDWIVPVYNPLDPSHPKGKSPLMWQTKGEAVGCVQEKLTVRPPCNGLANGIGTTTDSGDKGIYILHILPYAPGDTLNGPR